MARDISDWLEELGLGTYADAFAENEIDLGALPHLDKADLKELGLPMGPRKKLLAAISELETGEQTSADAGAPELARREAERRQVTVLFADMVNFTSTSENLGEEKTFALMERIFGLMAETVRKRGGSVRKFTGDGIMAVFGEPVALEDAPLRACQAAHPGSRVRSADYGGDAPLAVEPGLGSPVAGQSFADIGFKHRLPASDGSFHLGNKRKSLRFMRRGRFPARPSRLGNW